MAYEIRKVAVLGAGVMGASIAAHLANLGIPVLLLDIIPKELTAEEEAENLTLADRKVRDRMATDALKKLVKQKPAPLTSTRNLSLIETGNFEDDLGKLDSVDWIIEAVVENLAVKKSLYENVDAVRRAGTIISSNTSGISIEAMREGRSEDFQKHFLGTHFFNPPRYLKLLEVIPTSETAQDVVDFIVQFGEETLGKGVVIAKDTPNFIANRIGTYSLLVTLQEMEERGFSVGEVDSVTGTLIGRPKSATFRTLDVVGLDTFMHVAKNVYDQTEGEERQVFALPPFLKRMIGNGWLGAKAKQGFYMKKDCNILELDLDTFEYTDVKKLKAPSIEVAKQQKGLSAQMKTLIYANDRCGEILWYTLTPMLRYSALMIGEIADDVVAIDHAMNWGFGWHQGPFELWDAIGVVQSVQKMKKEGVLIPPFVQQLLDGGYETFYKEIDGERHFFTGECYEKVPINEKAIDLKRIKHKNVVLKKNAGASLIDIGDGIALLEFHSPSNAIGLDILQMIEFAIDEVESGYKGLVIANQGKNFCVGANLGLILLEAQDDNVFELDLVVRKFQNAMMKIRYSRKPVVAAPFGMTLGGGAEVCLAASQIQATAETYMGLVETGVGLIPGGAGNIGLYRKHLKGLPNGVEVDYQTVANKVFETIALAKVSTSAAEAFDNNFLDKTDGISVNADHQIQDAKRAALALYEKGYRAPERQKIPVTGESGYATLLLGAESMFLSQYISEYDLKIAKKLACVLSGGKLPYGTLVDEQYLLDLEREAFLSLVMEPKTQQRMQHMLLKGKPLRN